MVTGASNETEMTTCFELVSIDTHELLNSRQSNCLKNQRFIELLIVQSFCRYRIIMSSEIITFDFSSTLPLLLKNYTINVVGTM